MRDFDLEKLEYNKVKEKIKDFCKSRATLSFIDQLRPKTSKEEVIRDLELSKEFFKIAERINVYPFEDIRESIKKSTIKDSYLSVDELIDLLKVLRLVKDIRKEIGTFLRDYPNLQRFIRKLHQFSNIENLIDTSIDIRGFVKDTASAELSQIRIRKKSVEKEIHSRLDFIISQPDAHNYLSDRLITYRNGRYTIPVKTSQVKKFVGIVHGTSSSGYTTYLEPQSVVELNNQLIELKHKEEEEIKKVLKRITSYIGSEAYKLLEAFEALISIDYLKALYSFSMLIDAKFPTLGEKIFLKNAKHPLLVLIKDVTPINIDFHDKKGIVLTGPNTGGKTVALKTLGLCMCMFQSGMPIPADEDSILPILSQIYVDIGDEQSIEQSLSTFSAHVSNISEFLKNSNSDTLVLIDELGAGTDPTDGSALGIGILEYLKNKNMWVFATTHHTPIKLYAVNSNYYLTATVSFNKETLEPLYHIVYGSVGESMAFEVAKRFGMPEEVIDIARRQLPEEAMNYAQARESLTLYIEEYQQKLKEVEDLKQELQKLKAQEEKILSDMERQKEEIIKAIIKSTQEHMESILADIDRAISSAKERQRLKNLVKEKKKEIQQLLKEEEIKVGDWVEFMGSVGRVIEIKDSKASVIIGNVKVFTELSQLKRTEKIPTSEEKLTIEVRGGIPLEINLTGLTIDEALYKLDFFLEESYKTGSKSVKVIHGTGELKKIIQDYLSNSKYVVFYRSAYPKEGGLAASIVYLRKD